MSKLKNVYRRYAFAGAITSVAISIGFLMETTEASQAAVAPPDAVAANPQTLTESSLVDGLSKPHSKGQAALPKMPQEHRADAALPKQPVLIALAADLPVGMLPREEQTPVLACETNLVAENAAGAMVQLTLDAPCQPGEPVTIHHSGMKFSRVVGSDGGLVVVVPALSKAALFGATFANGDGAVVTITVDTLEFYDRTVIQWHGPAGLQLHAREFGADYGSQGHVWRGAPRDLTALVGGSGGFLTPLGDVGAPKALMAEVYTFPSGTATRAGQVVMSVEAEITNANCGRQLLLQTTEVRRGIKAPSHEMVMELPECSAAGEFLVLKNLVEDLTIAQN